MVENAGFNIFYSLSLGYMNDCYLEIIGFLERAINADDIALPVYLLVIQKLRKLSAVFYKNLHFLQGLNV